LPGRALTLIHRAARLTVDTPAISSRRFVLALWPVCFRIRDRADNLLTIQKYQRVH